MTGQQQRQQQAGGGDSESSERATVSSSFLTWTKRSLLPLDAEAWVQWITPRFVACSVGPEAQA